MKKVFFVLLIILCSVSIFANTYDCIGIMLNDKTNFSETDYIIKERSLDSNGKNDTIYNIIEKLTLTGKKIICANSVSTNTNLDNVILFYNSEYTLHHRISNNKENLIFEIMDDEGQLLERAYIIKNKIKILNKDFADAFHKAKNIDDDIVEYLANEANAETSLVSKEIIDFRPDKNNENMIVTLLLRVWSNYDKDKIKNSIDDNPFVIENGILKKYKAISTKVIIPDDVKEIGDMVFADMNSLEEVYLPKSLKKIGNFSFAYCSKLKKINLSNVDNIGIGAFKDCSLLEEIELSNNMKTIKSSSFRNCNLKEIIIPASVEYIEIGAFNDNLNIKSITFNDGLKVIDANAFGCSTNFCNDKLKTLIFPKSLEYIGEQAFMNCINIENIEFNEGLKIIKDDAFSNDLCFSNDKLDTLIFPNSLIYIGDMAFLNYQKLKKVIFNDNLEKIGAYAFAAGKIDEEKSDFQTFNLKIDELKLNKNTKIDETTFLR